jgi:hypothetical protein
MTTEDTKPKGEICPRCNKGTFRVIRFDANPGKPIFQQGQLSQYSQGAGKPTVTLKCSNDRCGHTVTRPAGDGANQGGG